MANELKPWKYDIQYGPEGEANYAWVYDDQGVMVATMKTHKAKEIVERMNTRPAAPVDELRTVGVTYLGMFFPLSKKAKWPKTGNELVTRSQAEAIIAAERAAIPILKGTAFKSGDGWKDTTREGEICFVWNKMHPAPYAPGQYPRVGKEHWSASTENFKFEPATPDEVVILFSALETQLAAAKKALEPFVLRADRYNDIPGLITTSDDVEIWQLAKNKGLEVDITVGDLRRARAAMEAKP